MATFHSRSGLSQSQEDNTASVSVSWSLSCLNLPFISPETSLETTVMTRYLETYELWLYHSLLMFAGVEWWSRDGHILQLFREVRTQSYRS
jgi:hypothetical protein